MQSNQQLIEVILYGKAGGNTATSLDILDQPMLKDAEIYGIETYTAADIPVTLQQNAVATVGQLQATFLTAYLTDISKMRGPGNYVQRLPLVSLHTLQNADTDPFERFPFEFSGQIITWDKCVLNFAQPFNNEDNISFLFNVNYRFTTKQ